MNLSLSATVWDDLDGEVSWASIGTVDNELSLLSNLGTLQTGTRAANLKGATKQQITLNKDIVFIWITFLFVYTDSHLM